MRVLLTGACGLLGQTIMQSWPPNYSLKIHATNRQQLDLSNFNAVQDLIHAFHPHIIINTAAFTDVDLAETNPTWAAKLNTDLPGLLAQEAEKIDAHLIHYSTDYVFDGRHSEPYSEDAPTNPLNTYGRSKLAGEQQVARYSARHFIIRTSSLHHWQGKHFISSVLNQAREGRPIHLTSQYFASPTASQLIACITLHLINQINCSECGSHFGVYHATNHGHIDFHTYGQYILSRAWEITHSTIFLEAKSKLLTDSCKYINQLQALRPACAILNTDKIKRDLGISLPTWQAGVNETLHWYFKHALGAEPMQA